MLRSDDINEIAAALAAAQSTIKNPEKKRVNPHYKSRYADLADGLDCIRPALSKNGIALVQATVITNDSMLLLDTRLVHSSGQYIGCTYPVAFVSGDHQKLGAALTYAKRQALFSLVGVCGDDDLDGEDSKDAIDTPITDSQVAEIRSRIEEFGADEQKFLKYMKVGSLKVLPASSLDRAMAALNAKAGKP